VTENTSIRIICILSTNGTISVFIDVRNLSAPPDISPPLGTSLLFTFSSVVDKDVSLDI
jgi:hypothetical protein